MPVSKKKSHPLSTKKTPTIKKRYFNRELSWLAFNRRVLNQAQSPSYPLLERIRYLSFVSSNLDEFFEIRVAGLMQQEKNPTPQSLSPNEPSPKKQLLTIRQNVLQLVSDEYQCWHNHLLPTLQSHSIFLKSFDELSPSELNWTLSFFQKHISPVLTPLTIDPSHPFPHLLNKALNILVWLKHPQKSSRILGILPVPRVLPRIIPLPTHKKHSSYIFLSDLLHHYAHSLFPGLHVLGSWEFRITRNSDLYIDDEEVQNLLSKVEQELHNRQRGAAVRLEIRHDVKKTPLNKLLAALDLSPLHTYFIHGPLNLMRLSSLYDLVDRPNLKFPPHTPSQPPPSLQSNFFQTLASQDILAHHPYESFSIVSSFLSQAASDPNVLAIKMTLYRTGPESPIISSLLSALSNGKQVTVLIELKARFDEANNITWAKLLEEAGAHVIYGLAGLKTHCKLCLVVRKEPDGIKQYLHLGTGNYNPKTAESYTDFSFFTANPHLTQESNQVFNFLTTGAHDASFSKLLLAPFNLHSSLISLIHQETSNAQQGRVGRIIAKLNNLVDKEIIDALYQASQAGVQIDLIVRGICCLIPGLKNLSHNIRVISILGRFLEHSRIFYFENASHKPLIFLGSADWMPRNFYKRVELLYPIESPPLFQKIRHLLDLYLKDNSSQSLLPNGSYIPILPQKNSPLFNIQSSLISKPSHPLPSS